MLNLVIGRAKTGKTAYCFQQFGMCMQHKTTGKPSYFVVPEQYALVAERQLLSLHELQGKTLFEDEVLSFKRLAYRILSQYGGLCLDHMDESGRRMLLTQIAYENKERLSYYTHLFERPKQISDLLSLFSEFEKYNLRGEVIASLSNSTTIPSLLKQKVNDLGILYQAYLQALRKICMTDGDLFALATHKAARYDFFKGCNVWIDAFTGFTALERELIIQMMRDADSLTVTFCMDAESEPIFNGIRLSYERLVSLAKEMQIPYQTISLNLPETQVNSYYKSPALRMLERSFTAYRGACYVPDVLETAQTGIEIHESSNVYEEVIYVADSILALHQQGIPFNEIAVAVRHPAAYASLIESVFPRVGIPFFLDDRRSVESNPFVVSVLSLLNIISNGFQYEDVATFLKTGFYTSNLSMVDRLENEILSCRLRGERQFRNSKSSEVHGLAEFVLSLKVQFNQCKDLGSCVEAFETFLIQHAFSEHIRALADCFTDENNLDKKNAYLHIWDISRNVFSQIKVFLGNIPVSTSQEAAALLYRLLCAGLSSVKTAFLPQNMQAVQIVGIDRSRMAHVSALFLMGANEGVLPASMDDSGILNDSEREWISSMAVELADDNLLRAGKERYNIYATLFAPSDFLCVSYPLRDGSGSAVMPSSAVVNRLIRLYPDIPITKSHLPAKRLLHKIDVRLPLVEETARTLFLPSSQPVISVSRLETYRKCPFMYFLDYGLKAKERELGQLEFSHIGDLMHKLIELGTAQLMAFGSSTCSDIIAHIFHKACAESNIPIENQDSGRGALVVARLNRFAVSALEGIQAQLSAGKFVPIGFEVPFGTKDVESLPAYTVPVGDKALPFIQLQGKIDRFDAYYNEGKLFIRVIDYKSSEQKLKFDDVYLGQRLQLMTYMKVLIEQKSSIKTVSRLAGVSDVQEIIPAGVLYFVLKDDLSKVDINGMLKENNYCMEGFLLDDADVLTAMTGEGHGTPVIPAVYKKDGLLHAKSNGMTVSDYMEMSKAVDQAVGITVREILSGNISPIPICTHNGKRPCSFCPYGAVCGTIERNK